MIAIIDYDMGNLRSVAKAFERVGAKVVVTRSAKEIMAASRVVLPGVGAFRDCMANLIEYGLVEPILKTIEAGKPFLGICLGLQLLFDESEEFGRHKGLGVIRGKVVRFEPAVRLKVPHIGWNSAKQAKASPLLNGINDNEFFYFVHSYYAMPEDKSVILTSTDYGGEFTSAISNNNVFACQFHPEKSQNVGLRLLENFSRID
ncbi:MAG: imidazole glycerol phosphate synthase subunit HisH [Deltaproteobacteria bacterium]|nr:imidazole glycerol phosphate synthase subunit HisH [Deltaproteobacteria bacterium]